METRRTFLKKSVIAGVSASLPVLSSCSTLDSVAAETTLKTKEIKKVSILWYSQTSNTEKCGIVLAKTFQKKGIRVQYGDLCKFEKSRIADQDLLIIGSPVFYYDTPDYVKAYIRTLPDLQGMAVAGYVTFGGPEGNQYNAACSIIEELGAKSGAPVGIEAFMAAKSYPPSFDKYEKSLKSKSIDLLPNRHTYKQVRSFADRLQAQVNSGAPLVFNKKVTLREFSTYFNPVWWSKLSIDEHYIQRQNCVECGACAEKCPTGSIDLSTYSVNTDTCALCFGCLNNCENQAMIMVYGDERLTGFKDFLKLNQLKFDLPPELDT